MKKLAQLYTLRVYYRDNPVVTGWANPNSIREVYGITNLRVIRKEIDVIWDIKYPRGYIDMKNIVKVTKR